MPVPIAELFVSVSADVSAAISGLNSLENRLNTTRTAFQQATPAALLFAGAGAAIGTGLTASIGVAATFEKQMSGVRAVMSPTEAKQFGSALDDLAISLGAATTFTAQQVGGAFEELLKLGVSAPAILSGAGHAVLGLAAATGAPLTDAATVAAQALNAFKLPVEELPGVVDVLAGVINVTAADLNDIKLGFSDVAAVAHGMGLSLTDTAVTLGIFRDNALTGNTAGTALKTMLLGLQPSTKQQKALFEQLGLTVGGANNQFFDATGNIKDMASVAGVLQNALGGMTKQQRNATLEILFGTQGMQAASILFEQGAEGVRKYTDEVKKISAADQAAERLNNLLGRLEQLGGAFQSAQIIIGRFFLPVVGAVADRVKEIINAFGALSPAAQRAITAFVAIAGAAAALIAGFVLLGPAVALLAPSFGALLSLLPRLLAIFGPIGVAVAILATDFLGIRTALAKTFAGAASILGNFGLVFDKAVNGDVAGALDTLQAILGALVPGLGPILVDIRGALTSAFTQFGPILSNFGLVVQKLFSGDVAGAFDTFRAIIGAISPPLGQFADVLGRIGGAIGAGVGAFFQTVLPKVAEALGGFAAGAGEGFSAFFTQTLPPILETIGGFAGDVGQGLFNFFTVTLPPILATVKGFAGDAITGFVAFFREHLPAVSDALDRFAANPGASFIGFFTSDLPNVIATAQTWTADTTAGLVDFFQNKAPGIIAGLVSFTPQSVQNFLGFFKSFDEVKAQVESLQPLFASLGNFFTAFANFSAALASLETRATGALFGNLATSITTFADQIAPKTGPIAQIGETLQLLGTQLAGVTDFFNNAADALNKMAGALNAFPIEKFLQVAPAPGGGGPAVGGAAGDDWNNFWQHAPGGNKFGTAFNPNGGGGGSLINIGQLIISSEAEAEAFLQRMAEVIRGSAGRVNVPPDNSGNPALTPVLS